MIPGERRRRATGRAWKTFVLTGLLASACSAGDTANCDGECLATLSKGDRIGRVLLRIPTVVGACQKRSVQSAYGLEMDSTISKGRRCRFHVASQDSFSQYGFKVQAVTKDSITICRDIAPRDCFQTASQNIELVGPVWRRTTLDPVILVITVAAYAAILGALVNMFFLQPSTNHM